MYPIDKQQLYSLIHEVVSTYVWQFLAKILNYDRETCKPDFTAQWENLTDDLAGDIQRDLHHHFPDIASAAQAEHRLDDILTLVSNELANRTAVSDTDRRIGLAESWDRWLEMMQEDNWGQEPGYYVSGQHIGVNIEAVLQYFQDPDFNAPTEATVELRLRNQAPETWTREQFITTHA